MLKTIFVLVVLGAVTAIVAATADSQNSQEPPSAILLMEEQVDFLRRSALAQERQAKAMESVARTMSKCR